MTPNKYLEKVASMGGTIKSVGRAGFGILKDVASGIGNQFHKAMGGAERDFMHDKMGITDGAKLMNPDFKTRVQAARFRRSQNIAQSNPGLKNPGNTKFNADTNTPPKDAYWAEARKLRTNGTTNRNTLKDSQNAGRIASVGIIGGAAYAGNKIINHINDNNYQQPQYY